MLKEYQNIKVFSRYGSIIYSSVIAYSHPNAIQISDRFYILKNLTSYCKDYLSKYIKNNMPQLDETKREKIYRKMLRRNKI